MIPYIHENLFKQNSVKKNLLITDNALISLENEDLYLENFELSEGICPETDLVFGSCVSSCLKFTTSDLRDFKGKTLEVSVVLDDDSNNPFRFGYYKVYEDTLTADRRRKDIVAYDALYDVLNANVMDWYDTILPTMTSEVTLKQFRDSFFLHFGITQETVTLVNDSMTVQKTVGGDMLSGADVLKAICEINGCFGRINRNGNFEYIFLGNTEIEIDNYINVEYATYETTNINKLQIRQEDGDIGVIVGSGTNAYVIEGNLLLYGKGTDELSPIATNIYNIISQISYVPSKVNIQGNPCLEVGDLISITTNDETEILTYILNRVYKGIQSQKDVFTADGNKEREEQINTVNSQLRQLRGKSNKLEISIEETRSTITDVAAGLQSEITQTAEGLEVEIQRLQSEIDGEIEYFERSGTPTLTNYPAWDFTSAFKCDGTKKCAPIYNPDMTEVEQGETGQYPHFYYTEQDYQDHLRDLVFDTSNAVSYRFNKQTEGETTTWYWQEIADSETAYILQQISELKITSEELSSDMTSVEATVSSQGLQIATNTSNITQTAQSIQTEVTRATTAEGTLRSSIQQNATDITARVTKTGGSSSSFAWNLQSDQFKLTSNSTDVLVCNSGGIEIKGNAKVTGQINATSGTIAGWTISSAAISRTNGSNTIRIQSDGTIVNQQNGQIKYALQYDGHAVFNDVTINGYATTGQLSAVDAKFTNLNADYITSGTINAARIAAGSISGGKISANTITAGNLNMSSLSSSDVYVGTLRSTNSIMYMGGNSYTPQVEIVYNNHRYAVLATLIR